MWVTQILTQGLLIADRFLENETIFIMTYLCPNQISGLYESGEINHQSEIKLVSGLG